MKGGRGWLALLLGLALVRGLIYAAVVPPWQAPDESGHFEYAWLIAHLGRLPSREDVSPFFERELLGSLYEWRYGEFVGRALPEQMPGQMAALPWQVFARNCRTAVMGRFSLAYAWTALFIWPIRNQDLAFQLYTARFSSVLLNVAIVWLAWSVFRELMPRRQELVVAMTAFVIFLPQHAFINASVGDGPLAELAACTVLYGWLLLFRRGVHAGSIVAVVVGTLVGLWTKNVAAFLLPFDTLALMAFLAVHYLKGMRRERLAYLVLGVALLGILGWVALQTQPGQAMSYRARSWLSDPRLYLESERVSLDQALWGAFDSFWGQFGWMSVRPGHGWYVLVYILTVTAVEGWILPRSRLSVPPQAKWLVGGALLLVLAVWMGFLLLTPSGINYYQGRYVFPATVPVAFFTVGGWARWVPERWQQYFTPVAVILLAALDAAAICLALWPFFYAC